jgi:Lipocalin-like domain
MERPDSTGQWRPFWNEQPIGLLTYTSEGHVSAQLYDSRRPRLGVRWENAPAEAARTAYVGLITYFGTYTVDPGARTIAHRPEGAMSPDWIGSPMVRGYRFLGPDRIELRVLTTGDGQRAANGSVMVWERAPW